MELETQNLILQKKKNKQDVYVVISYFFTNFFLLVLNWILIYPLSIIIANNLINY